MQECIFCKIIKGEVPSQKIYEDGDFIAFLDINPRSKGHFLVVPKQHFSTFNELPKELMENLYIIIQEFAGRTIERLGAKGYNIGSNNGAVAGQAVPHLHVHVIPRYDEGKDKMYGFEAAFPVKEELKAQLNEITSKLKGEISEESPEEKPKEEKKGKPKWKFLEFSDKPEFEED